MLLALPLLSCRPVASVATERHTVSDTLRYERSEDERQFLRSLTDSFICETTSIVWSLAPDSSGVIPTTVVRTLSVHGESRTESASLSQAQVDSTAVTDSLVSGVRDSLAAVEDARYGRRATARDAIRHILTGLAIGFGLGLLLRDRLAGLWTLLRSLLRG